MILSFSPGRIGEAGRASKKPSMEIIDENAEVSLDQVGNIDDPEMLKAIEKMEKDGENYFGESQSE